MTELYNDDAESKRRILAQAYAIEAAIGEAGREARLRHKQLGQPIVCWQDGRVVWIPPEEIVVDSDSP
jgi:hypothetical protein